MTQHETIERLGRAIQTVDQHFAYSRDMNNIDPVEFGRLQSDVHTLKGQMEEVRDDLKTLLAMANQGKGGLWMFRTAYVAAGGLAVWALEHFITKALK